jgi:hypothetical protein
MPILKARMSLAGESWETALNLNGARAFESKGSLAQRVPRALVYSPACCVAASSLFDHPLCGQDHVVPCLNWGSLAEGASMPDVIMQLKQRSMEHLNACMAQQSNASASAAEQDEDMMEQPAEDAVEDDAIQKMATQGSGSKRQRTGGSRKKSG